MMTMDAQCHQEMTSTQDYLKVQLTNTIRKDTATVQEAVIMQHLEHNAQAMRTIGAGLL